VTEIDGERLATQARTIEEQRQRIERLERRVFHLNAQNLDWAVALGEANGILIRLRRLLKRLPEDHQEACRALGNVLAGRDTWQDAPGEEIE